MGELARRSETSIIVSDSRDLLADMFHTLRNDPVRIYAKAACRRARQLLRADLSLPGDVANNVLFVTTHPVDCAQTPELVQSWRPTEGYYRGKTIFSLQDFAGLPRR